jgi:hypothetical protein
MNFLHEFFYKKFINKPKKERLLFFLPLSFLILTFSVGYGITLDVPDYEVIIAANNLLKGLMPNHAITSGLFTYSALFSELFKDMRLVVRSGQYFFILLTALSLYLFAKTFYNRETAFIAFLIFSTATFFTLNLKAEYSILPFFTVFPLLLLAHYIKTNKGLYLFLATIILGYGVSIKILLFHFVLSLILSFLVINLISKKKLILISKIFFAGIFFIIGISPLIIAEAFSNFPLVKWHQSVLYHTDLNFLKKTELRVNTLFQIFSPKVYAMSSSIIPPEFYSLSFFSIFLFSFFWLIFARKKKDLFIIFLTIFYFFFSIVGVDAIIASHLFPIVPLIILIMSKFLAQIDYKWKTFLLGIFILLGVTLLIQVNEIVATDKAIIGLPKPEVLTKSVENASTIVCPNRICVVLRAYYGENKKIYDIPHEEDEPITYKPFQEIDKYGVFFKVMKEKNVLYVFPSTNWFKGVITDVLFERFKNVSLQMNKTIHLLQVINTSSGEPIYEIWETK